MTQTVTMAVPSTPPAPPPAKAGHGPAGTFNAIATLGAVYAGFDSHRRNPNLLASALVAVLTFVAVLVTMYALHAVVRVTLALMKLAIPAAALLLIGCAQHWPWAETAVHWLEAVGRQGLADAEQAWGGLRAE